MRHQSAPACLLATTLLVLVGCLHAPMLWSPDGKWLAYTVEVRPIEAILRPGWLFESATTATISIPPATRPTGYRIWATRGDTGASVLLEESSQPLTGPGWSPNGRALAFGRIVAEADGTGKFEVVLLDGPNHRRVLSSRPLAEITAEASRLPGQAIVWSPDGVYLAVPQLNPLGLAIIRADTGRQVNAINDAFLPSWSPDSTRLAFYMRGTGDTLQCIDSPHGPPRILAEVGQAGQAPVWTRDNLSVIVVSRKALQREAEAPGDQAELTKVRVDNGLALTIRTLASEGVIGRDRSVQGVSIAMDSEGENLFCATVVEGMPRQITWYRPREDAVYKKFSIVDYTAPMGSLSLSPDGRTLAARVGSIDRITAPALCDLDSQDLRSRLIAPDDASRIEWVATLLVSAKSILNSLPTSSADPNAALNNRLDRPTLLPVTGEFDINSEPIYRLRRIGKLGRTLCDRPADAGPADPSVTAILSESRVFFEYLSENYQAALNALEMLEEQSESPDRRARLLALRAQISIAQGNVNRAGNTIAFLREMTRKPGRPIEWDGNNYVMTPVLEPGNNPQGWPDYLAWRASVVRAKLHEDGPVFPINPDAPRPRMGFEVGDPRLNLIFPERPFLNDPGPPPGPGDRGNNPPRLRLPPREMQFEAPRR